MFGEKSIFLVADLIDSCSLVEFECFDFFGTANFSCNLILHVLVSFTILKSLILLGKSKLSERINLLLNSVVFGSSDGLIVFAVLGLKEGTLKYIFGLTFGQLHLEESLTVSSIRI